jgi:fatty-acyl-CoA synthase
LGAIAQPLTARRLQLHLAVYVATGQIPKYAVPERIEFVAALPRTSVGKLDKKALRANSG